MSDRCFLLKNIVVECAAEDVEKPALKGLGLTLLFSGGGYPLQLEKISEAKWKYDNVVKIFPCPHELSILPQSETAGYMPGINLSMKDWDKIQDNIPPETYLKRDFDIKDLSLSLSLRVQLVPSTTNENPVPHLPLLSNDDPLKFDQLNSLGIHFLQIFRATRKVEDICRAIDAYRQAATYLPTVTNDPRWLRLLADLCICSFEYYQADGRLENLQAAIMLGEIGRAKSTEEDAIRPSILSNLGISYWRHLHHCGNLNSLAEGVKNLQEAIRLTPAGHPDLPGMLSNLGLAFSGRFEIFGDLDDISEAIKYQRRAVDLTPYNHLHFPSMLTNLGVSFWRRFDRNGDLVDISEAIEISQRAVHLTPDDHPDLPGRLANLGIMTRRRFERHGDPEDISEAIKYQQRAVYLSPDGHAELPTLLSNLGNSFSQRFGRTGDIDDISEAIKNQRRAVDLTLDGHAELSLQLTNLGSSLRQRFQRSGNLDDISEAIVIQQRAVHLMADGHAQLPALLTKLGGSFRDRFKHSGDMNDLLEALKNHQRSVELTPDGHADLPIRLTNLGFAFLGRFESLGDLEDISEAIQKHQRAVYLTPSGHTQLPDLLTNLGLSFFRCFEYSGNVEDLFQAIKHQRRAVDLTPDGDACLPALLSNLGNSFSRCFEYSGNMENLSQAIKNQQRAVDLTPDNHAQLPSLLTNLGTSLLTRFQNSRDLDDISKAITDQQRAIDLIPEGHAQLPALLTNIGVSFCTRFECTGDPDDLCKAIEIQERVVYLMPVGHPVLPGLLANLGISLLHRFQCTRDLKFFEEAISKFRRSATSTSGPLSNRLRAAQNWAACLKPVPSLELLDAHACIIQLLSLLSGLENTVQRRHQTLVEYSQLSLAASAAALSLDRPDKALEWLIEGRCIVWNQINQLRTPVHELRTHDPVLADRFSAVSNDLERAGARSAGKTDDTSSEEQVGKHIKLVKERDRLLATIRKIPDFESFLQPRKCADIMRRLPDEGIIVIISIHEDRCDALALMTGADEPMHIPLSLFSYQEAERLAKGLHGHLRQRGLLSRIGIPMDDPTDLLYIDLVEVLSVLWRLVVLPILESLAFSVSETEPKSRAKLPRIWWCPTGPLAFLPIHSAGIYVPSDGLVRQCLSDFVVSSYIPTVNALLKSTDSNSVKKYGDVLTGLLIVSQPNTPGRKRIPHAADETKGISSRLINEGIPFLPLDDEQGTVGGVLKAMESFSSVHFACHASQHTTSPLESSIHLHDGALQLSEIMNKNLPYSDFAFLSACQTSMGDRNLPEEVVHLAAGMLAAGYRSVVGTMWSIVDKHGADIADLFYKGLLENATKNTLRINGGDAARALHHATQQFRESISSDYLVWVPYVHIGI